MLAPLRRIWRDWTSNDVFHSQFRSMHPSLFHTSPYTGLSAFITRYFEYKVQKLSINAEFTCPNRDGTKGRGGCTYCNNQTFNPEYCATEESVRQQLERGKTFFRRAQFKRAQRRGKSLSETEKKMKFLAYFQAYTNTYGELDRLKDLYEEALSVEDVVGLVVGTRPDCMPDELLQYFAQLHKRKFVLIEYGVESTSDISLQRINRGHDYACSVEAIRRTAALGIPVGAHLILGLPGESRDFTIGQAETINKLPISTLKLHQLQIVKGTAMAREFEMQQQKAVQNADFQTDFHLYSAEEYATLVVDFLEHLRPNIAVERFTSSSPRSLLLAPDWGLKNYEFTALVEKEFAKRGTQQGCRLP